jgi:tetratricopeptide (TPR) repeat protein
VLGTRMKRLRLARGMTQKELADPKYSYAYVSTIEAGRRNPSKEAIEHFASKLGVTADELATGAPADLAPRLELRLHEARVALSDGRVDDAASELAAIAKEAKRHHLVRVTAKTEEGLGLACERRAEPEEALEHYQRSEELLRDEPPTEWVDAVAGMARSFEAMGDVRYAIFILESLLDRLERERLRDPDALARLHASLVFAYMDAGIHRKAAESAAELEALAPRVQDPIKIAQMHMNVARLFLHDGRIPDAQRSLRRAEEAYRHLNLRAEMGVAHLALGYVASREGNLSKARRELEHAIGIFEETSDELDLASALNELARVERLDGWSDRARSHLERSLSLLGGRDTPIVAGSHRELGLALAGEDPVDAEKHFRVAIELYERSGQSFEIALTYRALGDLLHDGGDGGAASEAYRTGIMALEPAV